MKVAGKLKKKNNQNLILLNFAGEFIARNIGEATWSEKHDTQM